MIKYNLTIKDFSVVKLDNFSYFSYSKLAGKNKKKIEVCLEPCLNGFCIGVYDSNQQLTQPKQCTNLKDYIDPITKQIKTVDMANAVNHAIKLSNNMLNNKTHGTKTI